MEAFWYAGGPEYDCLCQPLAATVRAVGQPKQTTLSSSSSASSPSSATASNSICSADEWQNTVDGLVAQMILCDQVSRNLFRGTKEAYAYDETARRMARQLTDFLSVSSSSSSSLSSSSSSCSHSLTGEFYPAYLYSMVTTFMHSESLADHQSALQLLQLAREQLYTAEHLRGLWSEQEKFELEHKSVIDQFGRYPHRNALYGRTNTAEEEIWLNDKANLPGWARSQN
jgi:uncharacterized protein (DUF924 family)